MGLKMGDKKNKEGAIALTKYISYGSNLNLKDMAKRCPTAHTLGVSRLLDYRLVFRRKFEDAYLNIERAEGFFVPVMVWEIGPKDEAALDQYEGYPDFYGKDYLSVSLRQKTVSGMIYVMNEGYVLGKPNEAYYETVCQGYLDCGFDLQILEQALAASTRHLGGK